MDMIHRMPHAMEYGGLPSEKFSESSIRLHDALYAPLQLSGDFTPESDAFSPTPLDTDAVSYGPITFARVSSLYLEQVMQGEHVANLPEDVRFALENEMQHATQRRISKNKINMNILTQVLSERISSESCVGKLLQFSGEYENETSAGLDGALLDALIAARAGKATLEERVRLLELVPEMGSIEIAKTTCPGNVELARANQHAFFESLAQLRACRPDWTVEFVAAKDSGHRIVSDMDSEVSFDPRIIVSKWTSARIDTGRVLFDVVNKQSNILLDKDTPGVMMRNIQTYAGQVYDVQPGNIMQYIRLSTQRS